MAAAVGAIVLEEAVTDMAEDMSWQISFSSRLKRDTLSFSTTDKKDWYRV